MCVEIIDPKCNTKGMGEIDSVRVFRYLMARGDKPPRANLSKKWYRHSQHKGKDPSTSPSGIEHENGEKCCD